MTLITSIVCPSFQVKQDTDKLRVMYREGPDDTPFHTLLAEGLVDGPVDVCELNIALFIAFELAVSQALLRFNFFCRSLCLMGVNSLQKMVSFMVFLQQNHYGFYHIVLLSYMISVFLIESHIISGEILLLLAVWQRLV